MVIANLDAQVEKVFGLSPANDEPESTNVVTSRDAVHTNASRANDSAFGDADAQEVGSKPDDDGLDDGALPVWLL